MTFDEDNRTGLIDVKNMLAKDEPSQTRQPYLILLSGTDEGRSVVLKDRLTVGRAQGADLQLYDDGVSREHARFELDGENVRVVDLGSTNGTWVNGTQATDVIVRDGDRVHLGSICEIKVSMQDPIEAAFTERQYSFAKRDALTGCFNKRHLVEQLTTEFSFAKRHNKELAVALIDLDHFKQVNDTYGHPAGDKVLSTVAATIQESLRDHDLLARFGGEELVIVMRQTNTVGAMVVLERLRKEVEALEVDCDGTIVKVTLSAGIASYPTVKVDEASQLLRRADEAVYRAKDAGRNRCCT